MNIECQKIFPKPVWSAILDIDNNNIYNFCKRIRRNDLIGKSASNYLGWQSNDMFPDEHEELNPLFDSIYNVSFQALDDIGYEVEERELNIVNFWININNDVHSINLSHTHPQSTLSGVYYVKCDENSGRLGFSKDSVETYLLQSAGDYYKNTEFNSDTVFFNPIQSKLIIFPSWLPHEVTNNSDNSERISISFNVVFAG
tara:strand:- start:487 stop:1086 length:600 start_codon:yes stop_codon:yes gene_type:complete